MIVLCDQDHAISICALLRRAERQAACEIALQATPRARARALLAASKCTMP